MEDVSYHHPSLQIMNERIEKQQAEIVKPPKFYETNLFMWLYILIVGIGLLFFTFSLVKSNQKE